VTYFGENRSDRDLAFFVAVTLALVAVIFIFGG